MWGIICNNGHNTCCIGYTLVASVISVTVHFSVAPSTIKQRLFIRTYTLIHLYTLLLYKTLDPFIPAC